MQRDEDPAATPEEQDQAPAQQEEHQSAVGAGHEDPKLPGDDPPPETIHES